MGRCTGSRGPRLVPSTRISRGIGSLMGTYVARCSASMGVGLLPSLLDEIGGFAPVIVNTLVNYDIISLKLVLFVFNLRENLGDATGCMFCNIATGAMLFAMLDLLVRFGSFVRHVPVSTSTLCGLTMTCLDSVFSMLVVVANILYTVDTVVLVLLGLGEGGTRLWGFFARLRGVPRSEVGYRKKFLLSLVWVSFSILDLDRNVFV